MASTFVKQEEFRADRLKYVGGSDTPNLYSLEPYYCARRLAYTKTDVIPDFPFTGNDATDRGNAFERLAADVYAAKTGRDIRKAFPKADKIVPILRPQPDFEIVNDARGKEWGPGMLSIKVPGYQMFVRLKAALEAWRTEPTTDWQKERAESGKKALLPYILQVQSECGAYNRKWGSFAFFWADGMQIEFADIDADGELIDDIRNKARQFWATKESKGVDGFERLDAKSKQCGRCEFRVTCQSANLLKLLESANKDLGDREFAVIPQLDAAVQQLWERQELQDEAGALVDEAKEVIRKILADCDAAEGFETRAYNSLRAGRLTVQREQLMKFAKELGEQADILVAKFNEQEPTSMEWTLAAQLLLSRVSLLHGVIEEKFINKGKPYRELRTYPLKKKEGKVGQ